MAILKRHEVEDVKLFDPAHLDEIEGAIPDFYVAFDNPLSPGDVCHIPCRELDPGEANIFMIAVREKYPDMPEGKYTDYSDAEKKQFHENQKTIDALDNEMFTDVAVCAFLQDGWTRERVAKLPKSTRRDAYEGATAGLTAVNPVVDTFSEKSNDGGSKDAGDVSDGDVDGT